MPYAEVTSDLPLPLGSQAMPTRGANAFISVEIRPAGTPGSPGYSNPAGAFGMTVDCFPGSNNDTRL